MTMADPEITWEVIDREDGPDGDGFTAVMDFGDE